MVIELVPPQGWGFVVKLQVTSSRSLVLHGYDFLSDTTFLNFISFLSWAPHLPVLHFIKIAIKVKEKDQELARLNVNLCSHRASTRWKLVKNTVMRHL